MNSLLKIFILFCGLSFSGAILYLLLKKKINERHSIIWLGSVIVILVVSANPEWFDSVAGWFGISYPPSLLFLLSVIILSLVVLYQSVQISILNDKLRELAQHVALEHHNYDNIKRERTDTESNQTSKF